MSSTKGASIEISAVINQKGVETTIVQRMRSGDTPKRFVDQFSDLIFCVTAKLGLSPEGGTASSQEKTPVEGKKVKTSVVSTVKKDQPKKKRWEFDIDFIDTYPRFNAESTVSEKLAVYCHKPQFDLGLLCGILHIKHGHDRIPTASGLNNISDDAFSHLLDLMDQAETNLLPYFLGEKQIYVLASRAGIDKGFVPLPDFLIDPNLVFLSRTQLLQEMSSTSRLILNQMVSSALRAAADRMSYIWFPESHRLSKDNIRTMGLQPFQDILPVDTGYCHISAEKTDPPPMANGATSHSGSHSSSVHGDEPLVVKDDGESPMDDKSRVSLDDPLGNVLDAIV
jgi:hypothetical protein